MKRLTAVSRFSLFAYGTLMVEEIMTLVVGSRLEPATPAVLQGYRRNLLLGEHYPGIRPQPNQWVNGLLYAGLNPSQIRRLDLFEGEMYRRQSVSLALTDKSEIEAETYVLRPQYYSRMSDTPWDLETFLRKGRKAFLAEYAGVSRVHDNPDWRA